MKGLELIDALRRLDLRVPVILMTGCADDDTAIQAVQLGAFDYLEKPLTFEELFKQLTPVLRRALDIDWRPSAVAVPGEARPAGAEQRLLGKGPPMVAVQKDIGLFAA